MPHTNACPCRVCCVIQARMLAAGGDLWCSPVRRWRRPGRLSCPRGKSMASVGHAGDITQFLACPRRPQPGQPFCSAERLMPSMSLDPAARSVAPSQRAIVPLDTPKGGRRSENNTDLCK